jgi:short-subunit dehydrogenase
MHLAGRVAVVTGASRGIGQATARQLAAGGATVVCVGRDEPALQRLAAEINGSVVTADLTDPSSAQHIVAHSLAAHGQLDIVVANAGVGYTGDFSQMPANRISELVDVNVRAPILLARACIEALRAPSQFSSGGGAAIVFVSSIAGAVGVPGESVYSACKAAIEAFAAVLREELRGDQIAVSTVLPGVVDTDFLRTRGVPYNRRFPRPMPPERLARVIVDVIQNGNERRIEPRWLGLPARFAATAPNLYRVLARRFS